jgi:hypothetical protein
MMGSTILSLHERANSSKDMGDAYEKEGALSLEKELAHFIK